MPSHKSNYFYGIHAVQAMLAHRPEHVLELFIQSERAQKDDARIEPIASLAKQFGVTVQYIHKSKLDTLVKSTQHQGVTAHARPLKTLNEHDIEPIFKGLSSTSASLKRHLALFLLLDQISDPHNLGAIMRTAAAMGVTAVVTTKDNSASLTPAAMKVAAGGAELVPFIQVTNLTRTLKVLKKMGCLVVGTALSELAKPLSDIDLNQPCALVMGAEEKGLRRLTLETCDELGCLPMLGDIQSLNVSVATGIALYEALCQRTSKVI